MPRLDYVSLTKAAFLMPSVDHMFNKNILNVNLERIFTGNQRIPTRRELKGIFVNLVRLTDKALREYDAARAELIRYVDVYESSFAVGPYVRAIDHMENCIDTSYRAVLNARALYANGYGRKVLQLTDNQERRLRFIRNTIEHSDERLIGAPAARQPVFQASDPFTLRLANRVMIVGRDALTYRELAMVITKMYRTIEAIRGPSVRPGDTWTNSKLRTDPGPAPVRGTLQWSDHAKEVNRLIISH
jgi:hypothetical protein